MLILSVVTAGGGGPTLVTRSGLTRLYTPTRAGPLAASGTISVVISTLRGTQLTARLESSNLTKNVSQVSKYMIN